MRAERVSPHSLRFRAGREAGLLWAALLGLAAYRFQGVALAACRVRRVGLLGLRRAGFGV